MYLLTQSGQVNSNDGAHVNSDIATFTVEHVPANKIVSHARPSRICVFQVECESVNTKYWIQKSIWAPLAPHRPAPWMAAAPSRCYIKTVRHVLEGDSPSHMTTVWSSLTRFARTIKCVYLSGYLSCFSNYSISRPISFAAVVLLYSCLCTEIVQMYCRPTCITCIVCIF